MTTRWILLFSTGVGWCAVWLALSGDVLYLLSGGLNATALCLCLFERQTMLDTKAKQ